MFTRAILNFRRGFPKCKHRHELFSKSIIEISLYDFCYLASIVLIHKCSKISLQFRLKNFSFSKNRANISRNHLKIILSVSSCTKPVMPLITQDYFCAICVHPGIKILSYITCRMIIGFYL